MGLGGGDIHRRWLSSWVQCWGPGKMLSLGQPGQGAGCPATAPCEVFTHQSCSSSPWLRADGCWGQLTAPSALCSCQGALGAPAKLDQVPWSDSTRWLLSEADFNLPSDCSAFWGRWSNLVSNWELISADLTRARRGQFWIALKAIWVCTCWKPPGCFLF